MNKKDYKYQDDAVNATIIRLQEKSVHPIIAVPTGGGKTHIIAKLIIKFFESNKDKTVIVASHVKEILEQNHKTISEYLNEEIGLYSSMLNCKTVKRVSIVGIQSVYKKANEFKNVGMVLIDEAHLVTDENDGMYRKFLSCFDCNFVGLTATPYRSRGYLHRIKNALFTEISYDLTSTENFRMLIREGYLSKIYSKGTEYKMDTKGISIQAGDYNNKQLDKKFNTQDITEIALTEVLKYGKNYKKWLIFAISIEHAEDIRDWLNEHNINTGIVHSKMNEYGDDRDDMLNGFRSGFYRAMVNVNVLTTGLDIPDIDLIIMLRPTKSPVIYVQSVGRGLRVAEGKDHCLVMDFANNVAAHGPIDNLVINQKGEKRKGQQIVKECPECKAIWHPTKKVCDACGHKFEFKVKVEKSASNLDILKTEKKDWLNVHAMSVHVHKKINKPDSIRIDFICGLRKFSLWASIKSNSGYAAHNAKYILSRFYTFPQDFDFSTENIMKEKDNFKTPKRIFVDQSERYPRIEDMQFE